MVQIQVECGRLMFEDSGPGFGARIRSPSSTKQMQVYTAKINWYAQRWTMPVRDVASKTCKLCAFTRSSSLQFGPLSCHFSWVLDILQARDSRIACFSTELGGLEFPEASCCVISHAWSPTLLIIWPWNMWECLRRILCHFSISNKDFAQSAKMNTDQ